MARKLKPVDIAELASKVLVFPTNPKQKYPSQKLQHKIKGFVTLFTKTMERANQTMELDRKEGFKDLEIRKFVAQAMKEEKEDYSAMNVDSFESLLDNNL